MTETELLLSQLADHAVQVISQKRKATGFEQLLRASAQGGKVAGSARQLLEIYTEDDVVTGRSKLPVIGRPS
jgi:hypothetical protein